MARQATQGRVNSKVKFKICGTMFLYPKEKRIIIIGIKLQETESTYDKGQNATTLNVIDKIKEVKYFNKLDFIWDYNTIWIKEGDEWKAAFLTNKGLFEPKVMYFGLCNLLNTFQRIMNSIFQELHEEVLANCIDDFIILAETKKELEEQTIYFLKIAEKYNLCSK